MIKFHLTKEKPELGKRGEVLDDGTYTTAELGKQRTSELSPTMVFKSRKEPRKGDLSLCFIFMTQYKLFFLC